MCNIWILFVEFYTFADKIVNDVFNLLNPLINSLMKYKIHKVEAEEKLKIICEKYNVSIAELKEANPGVRFFKAIFGDEYVGCLQTLKIPIGGLEKEKANEAIPFFIKETDDCFMYEIKQKQHLMLGEQKLYETETRMIWKLFNIEVFEEYFSLQVEQVEHKLANVHSVVKELASFAQLFNIPLSRLHLKFLPDGSFLSILNQEEITQKWEELKETPKLKELQEHTETQSIITEGDKDFSDSKPLIQNSFLYQFFFPAIYGNIETSVAATEDEPRVFKSNIFQNQAIQFNVERENLTAPHHMLAIKFTAENIRDRKLKKLYDKQFKAMVKEEFDYEFNFTTQYKVAKQSGIIQAASCKVREQLTNNFVHRADYTIQLLKNKENE